jgi:lysophospholipase L1-like esterase
MSGFEWNWAVPGITAGQYEDFVTATLTSNPAYYSLRRPLDEQLRERADRVVIWLGGNDFRENYGRLYDGDDSDSLIDGLIDDLGRVIDYVKGRDSRLQIVLANIPDLGAAPSKKAAHPDSQKRARVTAATEIANARIAVLAAQKGVVVADVYTQTARLVRDEPTYFGAIQIINEEHPDNNPRYHFTRDGLHPNTASQIEIARIIIRAFNQGYGAGIRNINDAEALNLLGLDPLEPYRQWIAGFDAPKINFKADTDGDGLVQLVEYAFGLNPSVPDADQLPVTVGGPVPGISGDVSVSYRPDPARSRHARVKVQYLVNGTSWRNIPAENLVANDDGSFVAVIPNTDRPVVAKRLKVSIVPPSGSTTTIAVALPFE